MIFIPAVQRSRTQGRRYPTAIAAVVLVLILAACGGDLVRGDEAVLEGSVLLECSQDCKDHGSCGIAEGSNEEVLLLGAMPAFPHVSTVEFKGMISGTPVDIQETKSVTGIVERTGEEVDIRFYLVNQPTADTGGWIPGFCIVKEKSEG